MMESDNRKHYSYQVYENPDIAASFDEQKFGGAVGRLFRHHQEQLLRKYLPDIAGKRVLDLGAGTGRTALPISQAGARVAAGDASLEMLRIAQEKGWLQGSPIHCIRIDAHHLPFPSRSFHAVISFRLLMHVVDWRQTLREICRVASDTVIIDFPPRWGFAGLAPMIHPILKRIKTNYQPYRVFRIPEIVRVMAECGFQSFAIDRHIVLPFGFHRFIGSIAFTSSVERFLAQIGAADIWGAPVTIAAHRKE